MFALVPFVYEAVLAGIEDLLCMSGDPLAPNTEISGEIESDISWRAWRARWSEEQSWSRRRRLLQLKAKISDSEDVSAWQLICFAHSAGELWNYRLNTIPSALGWLNDRLDQLFTPAPIASVEEDRRVKVMLFAVGIEQKVSC